MSILSDLRAGRIPTSVPEQQTEQSSILSDLRAGRIPTVTKQPPSANRALPAKAGEAQTSVTQVDIPRASSAHASPKQTQETPQPNRGDSARYKSEADALEKENIKLSSDISLMKGGLAHSRGYIDAAASKQRLSEAQAIYDSNKAKISELYKKAEQAKSDYYGSLHLAEDYASLSAPGQAKRAADGIAVWDVFKGTDDNKYDFINDLKLSDDDKHGYRRTMELMSASGERDDKYGQYTPYSYMTEDEIGVYNYLYAKEGSGVADEFLGTLMNTLNSRKGTETYENLSDAGKALYWLPAGVDRFASGTRQLFTEEAVPTSPTQYTSGMVGKEAWDTNPVLGFAYDFGTTAANMAPSLLLSSVTAGLLGSVGIAAGAAAKVAGGVGSASMGLAAGGNAYTQKVNEGYTPKQARSYAILVGASEGALQYLLGGIGKLGGVSAEKIAAKVAGIDNALGRIALTLGEKMVSEGIEEGLQEILEPAFAALVFDEKYEVNFKDVAYSFLMGALTAGVLEGGDVIQSNTLSTSKKALDAALEGAALARNVQETNLATPAESPIQGGGTSEPPAGDAHFPTTQSTSPMQPQATFSEQIAAQFNQSIKSDVNAQTPAAQHVNPAQTQLQPRSFAEQVTSQLQAPTAVPTIQNTGGIDNAGETDKQWQSADSAEAISDGSGERYAGIGAGGQAGVLAERTGGGAKRNIQDLTAKRRQDSVYDSRLEPTTTRSLGITNGTDDSVVTVIPERMWDDEMRATVTRVTNETGLPVTYFIGSLFINNGSEVTKAKGAITDGRVFIQADSLRYTTAQIADHEIFHSHALEKPELISGIQQAITERYGDNELKKIATMYGDAYHGLYDISADNDTALIMEEIFADAYAGINAFDANAPRYADVVNETLEERGAARIQSTEANGVRDTRGPPEAKYSAMYRNPADSFAEFYNFVLANKGNPAENNKSYFTQALEDGSKLDIPFEAVLHVEDGHALTTEEYGYIFDGLSGISEASTDRNAKPYYNGTLVRLKINTPGGTAGVLVEYLPKRVIFITGFFGTEKGIDAWMKKGAPIALQSGKPLTAVSMANSFSINSIRDLLRDVNGKFSIDEAVVNEGHIDIDKYTAELDAKADSAKEERLRNKSRDEFVGTKALSDLGIKVANSVGIYQNIKSLIERDRAAKSIKNEVKKASRRLRATTAEKNFASGIVAGVYTEADIPSTMKKYNVMELAEYYMAERAVSTDMIWQQKADIDGALAEKMETLFKDSDNGRQSKMLVMNERTPERNMLKMFGDEHGGEINAAIFRPVHENEAERYRFINRMYNEVRTFEDSAGKQSKLTRAERAVVQQIIEGRAVEEMVAGMEMSEAIKNAAENMKNGEALSDVVIEFSLGSEERRLTEKYARWLQTQEMLENGKSDNVRVENAVKKYSEMYNLFYDAINDFLVAHGYEPIGFIKGYAPHIQPESNQNLLNKSLKALGINMDVTRLPTSIAGLTSDYKPKKRWNPFFLQRMGDVTEYDIAKGFESYVDYMSDILYHTDDIMRVRAAVKYFRRKYAREEISEALSQAEELRFASTADKTEYLREKDVIKGFSAMSAADINRMMDEYVDELYSDIKKTTKYSDFVMWLDNYANILAGKQSMADRGWEYEFGRESLNLGNRLTRIFARAHIAGSLSSALNQTAQLSLVSSELGVKYTSAALADMATMRLRKAEWAQESDFLTGKKGIDYLVTDKGQMIIGKMFMPMELVDGFVSTLAVRGKFLQEVAAGKEHAEAMRAADAYGRSVMGSRMKGSRPLAYEAKNLLSKMLHIFQLEAVNSWEHISQDLPRDFRNIQREDGKAAAQRSLAGVIVKMLLTSFLLNRLSDELYGGTPSPFDILGLTANFIASGQRLSTNEWLLTYIDNGLEKLSGERLFNTDSSKLSDGEFNWGAALADTGYNISNDIPFLRNASGMLGLGDATLPLPNVKGAASEISSALTPDEDGGGLSLPKIGSSLISAAAEVTPGGKQAKKTVQGIEALVRGGKYRGYEKESKLQYPVEMDFGDVIRAMMFGNNGMPETGAFYASDNKALTQKQTELYHSLTGGGADGTDIYDAMQDWRKTGSGDEEFSSYAEGVIKRNIIRSLNISDRQKLELWQGQTANSGERAKQFSTMLDNGMSWNEVMDAYDKYMELYHNDNMTAGRKATDYAHWADTQGHSKARAQLIKDSFAFYSHIPAEASRYDKFTDAGLDGDGAYKLTETIAALVPDKPGGKVTQLHTYKAVIDTVASEREQAAALSVIMGESEYSKLEAARGYGVTPAQYVGLKEKISVLDLNGSVSHNEVERGIKMMTDLNTMQKAVMWQLVTGAKSAKNNPFSVKAGEQVIVKLQENELPTLSLPKP